MGLYAGADYTSPYLIVDFEVQLSAPTKMNAQECFPNYQPVGKGRILGRGRDTGGKGWELTLCLRIVI
jgi:hypothetical protein